MRASCKDILEIPKSKNGVYQKIDTLHFLYTLFSLSKYV